MRGTRGAVVVLPPRASLSRQGKGTSSARQLSIPPPRSRPLSVKPPPRCACFFFSVFFNLSSFHRSSPPQVDDLHSSAYTENGRTTTTTDDRRPTTDDRRRLCDFGRRRSTFTLYFVGGACCASLSLFPAAAAPATAILGKFFITTAFDGIYVYASEVFEARGSCPRVIRSFDLSNQEADCFFFVDLSTWRVRSRVRVGRESSA